MFCLILSFGIFLILCRICLMILICLDFNCDWFHVLAIFLDTRMVLYVFGYCFIPCYWCLTGTGIVNQLEGDRLPVGQLSLQHTDLHAVLENQWRKDKKSGINCQPQINCLPVHAGLTDVQVLCNLPAARNCWTVRQQHVLDAGPHHLSSPSSPMQCFPGSLNFVTWESICLALPVNGKLITRDFSWYLSIAC